jgi:ribosomal protein S27AE
MPKEKKVVELDRPCRKCGSVDFSPHGTERVMCRNCGATMVIVPKRIGRPVQGERKMTNAERQRRYKQRRKKAPR